MRADRTAHEADIQSVPAEFRENYRFLTELIDCKQKNDAAELKLQRLEAVSWGGLRARLSRRQQKIIRDYLEAVSLEPNESFQPPVPPELEASIRVRARDTWLPWEGEAIDKIERWRDDVLSIGETLTKGPAKTRTRSLVAKRSGRGPATA
jgi:hypothetical protein